MKALLHPPLRAYAVGHRSGEEVCVVEPVMQGRYARRRD
jgi:hypothetical protein